MDELKEIDDQIEKVAGRLSVADSNGLFDNQAKTKTKITHDDIENVLKKAREEIVSKNAVNAKTAVSNANARYYEAIQNATMQWRFTNYYAWPVWFYLVGFFGVILYLYYFEILVLDTDKNGFKEIAIQSGMWGVIGSILRGFWFLRKKIDSKSYQKIWSVSFLSVPFIGGILGVFIFLIVYGGLASISESTEIKNPLAIFFFAGLAGFNWEWAVELFNKIGELLNSNSKK